MLTRVLSHLCRLMPSQSGGYQCTCCHSSCKTLGLCDDSIETGGARCSWSSCYSDVSFVTTLLRQLQQEFCLDTSAVFAAGASNGAMLVRTAPPIASFLSSWMRLLLYLISSVPQDISIVRGVHGSVFMRLHRMIVYRLDRSAFKLAGSSSCFRDAAQYICSRLSDLWTSAEASSACTRVTRQHAHPSNTRPMGSDNSTA